MGFHPSGLQGWPPFVAEGRLPHPGRELGQLLAGVPERVALVSKTMPTVKISVSALKRHGCAGFLPLCCRLQSAVIRSVCPAKSAAVHLQAAHGDFHHSLGR